MNGGIVKAVLLVLFGLGGPACSTAQNGAPVNAPGCYYFEEELASGLRLPWGVRLQERELEGWPALASRPGVRGATTLRQSGETDHPFGYWAETGTSVEIGYPGGGGLVLDLEWEDTDGGSALSGTARAVGDAISPGESGERPTHRVRLVRAACAS